MRYKRYPKYKDSEVEWLGKIPKHWDVKKLAHITPVKRGASPRPIDDPRYFDDNGKYGWVRIQDVTSSNGILSHTRQRLSMLGASRSVKLEPGSLFLSIAATVGVPCITDIKCCIHDGFVYFPILPINPMWLYRVFESNECFVGLGKTGTQLNLNTETVGGIKIPLPPASEQQTISQAISQEASRIDILIEKKIRFMELLNEKRQALITQAVTKGLDPNAEMKDSKVKWLGHIPKHWKLRKAKHIFFIKKQIAGKIGYDVLSVTQKGLKIKDITTGEGQLSMDYSKYQLVEIGDFVMNHMDLLTGWVDRSHYQGVTSPDYRVFSMLGASNHPEYFLHLCQVGYMQKIFYAYGQGVSHLGRWRFSADAFKDFIWPIPPKTEQQKIAQFIADQTSKIEQLLDKTARSIDLLKEYRSALITAAVTGQLDLREAAA
jgi:type I restriction enzyme S subunit